MSPAPLYTCGDQSSRIYFAGGGPWNATVDVVAQCPESGPDSLVGEIGKIDPCLENAVLEGLPSIGIQSSRDPRSIYISGLDHEMTVAINVDRSRVSAESGRTLARVAPDARRSAVNFGFAISPAVIVSEVEIPSLGGWRTCGTLELLAPGRLVGHSCNRKVADPRAGAGEEATFPGVTAVGFHSKRPKLTGSSGACLHDDGAPHVRPAGSKAEICAVRGLKFVGIANQHRIPGLRGRASARIQNHCRTAGTSRGGYAEWTQCGEVIEAGRRYAGIVR